MVRETKIRLPEVGCRDWIDAEAVHMKGSEDRRPSSKELGYHFRVYGREGACDFPYGTYLTYSAPFKVFLNISHSDTKLSLTPKFSKDEFSPDWKTYGKVGRELFRFADDLTDFFWW